MTTDELQMADVAIKAAALIGAAISVFIAFSNARYGKKKTKYEFFRDLYNDFLDPEILKTRYSVATFWMQKVIPLSAHSPGHADVSEISRIADKELPGFLERRLAVKFAEIDEAFLTANRSEIESTEEVLKRYEHLAKLVEIGVISKRDVQTFFYTMLADTFVVCVPFILYRRSTKPSYAHKMQALLELLPKVSGNWS